MKRLSADDARQLVYTDSGVWRVLLGALSLAGGVACGVVAWLGVVTDDQGLLVLWVFGGVLVFVGLLAVSIRRRVTLDLDAGVYESRLWVVVPVRCRRGSLADVNRVQLETFLKASGSGRHLDTVYQVLLHGPDLSLRVYAGEDPDESQALAEAELVARALGTPLIDLTADEPQVRTPDGLDESLRQRRERLRIDQIELPAPPLDITTRVHREEDQLVLDIPAPGLARFDSLFPVVLCLAVAGVCAYFVPSAFRAENMSTGIRLMVLGILGVFSGGSLVLAIGLAREALVRTRLIVSTDRLTVRERGPGVRREQTLLADDIKELSLRSNEPLRRDLHPLAIVARTDDQRVEFGAHLAEEEKAYLREAIERIVSA